MTLRVVIADDNPIVRMGLANLLELADGVEIVADAVNGAEALRLAHEHRPDVLLLDVRMPGTGGLAVVEEISTLCPVLMLTHSVEPDVIAKCLDGGATGYLVHGSFTSEELVAAIHDTAVQRMRLSPEAALVLARGRTSATVATVAASGGATGMTGTTSTAAASGLTPGPATTAEDPLAGIARRYGLSQRETEIMRLVVQGLGNQEVASALFIEAKTVKNHINRIFAKLHVTTRAQAIALCFASTSAGAH